MPASATVTGTWWAKPRGTPFNKCVSSGYEAAYPPERRVPPNYPIRPSDVFIYACQADGSPCWAPLEGGPYDEWEGYEADDG